MGERIKRKIRRIEIRKRVRKTMMENQKMKMSRKRIKKKRKGKKRQIKMMGVKKTKTEKKRKRKMKKILKSMDLSSMPADVTLDQLDCVGWVLQDSLEKCVEKILSEV